MKNRYNVKLLVLALLVLFTGFLTSCEDDADVDPSNGQVTLLSFGPSGVQHGQDIRFIGYNLNKVEAIELPGVTVPKASFKEHTAELIVLTVPQEAGEGLVTLKAPQGDVVSKTILSFEVPVTIASMTPEARPGSNITVTGNYLNWVKGVLFEKDTVKTFVSQGMNELVLQVPAKAKSGRLVFLTGGTEPLVIVTEQELTVTLPTITGLAPTPVERGANLTITGTNLDLATGVYFNGVTGAVKDFVSKTESQLVVMVPAEAGKGKIKLEVLSGEQVESTMGIQIAGDLPPLAALPYPMYTDARAAGWDNYSWGGAADWASTARVRQGEFAAKKTYDGSYDAIRLHNNTPVATASYTHFVFSAYGEPGTGGKTMNIVVNEQWGTPYTFKIVEGEWTTYSMPLTDLGSPASIGDILFQSAGWVGVVHYDHIGLK